MSFIYSLISLCVLVAVGLLTWRQEKLQGEDHEPDVWAVIKNVIITLIILIAFWQTLKVVSAHYVEYLWFKEVGYPDIWISKKTFEWELRLAGFFIAYIALTVTQIFAQHSVPRIPARPTEKREEVYGYRRQSERDSSIFDRWPVIERYYRWVSRLIKFLTSLGFAWGATWLLDNTLKVFHLVEWGRTDPVFGLDYSFYDAVLPWIHGIWNWSIIFLFASALYALCVYGYLLYRGSEFENFDDRSDTSSKFTEGATSHGILFVACLLVFFAVSVYLSRYDLIIDGSSNVLSGAGYIDVTTKIPAYGLLTWVWVLAAIVAVVYAFMPKRYSVAIVASGVVIVAYIVFGLSLLFNGLQYKTNPIGYEKPYIQNQIDGTKFAFGLDKVSDQGQLGYESQMTEEDLRQSDTTLNQARIVDWTPMLDANDTLNEFIAVYDFYDVDIDRYNGEEVMISVRELNPEQIPSDARGWVNDRFRYTHGYGYTVASVSEIDAQGEPKWIVRNLPPTGPEQFIVENPEIYFGEETSNFIFVNGPYKEFGRPEGNQLQDVSYEGPAGIPMGGFWRRFTLAVMMDDYRLVFTNLIDADTRIIFNRTLDQRLTKLGWFLTCDGDPYAVLGGYEVVYVRDCYTISNSLPYSQIFWNARYMRGSVKMTVGAMTGETNLYIVDPSDPIVRTWQTTFPGLFLSLDEMPSHLREHLRYPDDLIRAQAEAYALYHVTTPEAFFNRQDLWELAKEIQTVDGEASYADPRYVMMVIPGGSEEEFVSNIYFTQVGKTNLVAGMTARNDPEVYGQLLVYNLPRDLTVVGPQMFEARISQHEDLSAKVTLWNQQGSRVVWGQTIGLVLPAKDSVSVIFIRSLYLQSQEARIPSIKLVIISQGDRLVYANSLSGALSLLYSGGTTLSETPSGETLESVPAPTGTQDELIKQAQQHFDAAQTCAASGDWSCFGREMDTLKVVLEALQPK